MIRSAKTVADAATPKAGGSYRARLSRMWIPRAQVRAIGYSTKK